MAKDTHLLDSAAMLNYYSYSVSFNGKHSTGSISSDETETVARDGRAPSIVDGLLMEIYDRLNYYRRSSSIDSDNLTEHYSSASEVTLSEKGWTTHSDVSRLNRMRYTRTTLETKDCSDLEEMLNHLRDEIVQWNNVLLRQLKRRDRLITKRSQSYDVITAILQAVSPKRSVDTRMKFSIQPFPGDSGFSQWHDAMKMVARLPGGIPPDFRKRLWITLAERHIQMRKIDWKTTKRFCFNERSNPDDDKLGTQIVKDLHRTGCSMFSGDDAEHNQALLKRVLLAYARWNKTVGYCQGFNMLAAIILEVMEWQEEDALKVMLFLIEGVLPESYFANHLRGLSVDMAVFRDLLGLRLCSLSHHLDRLQLEARDSTTGTSYEPPLTNVFTMQWFLTLFSNCLPKSTVLRVWDLIFLEGNEVLLRTALAIWDGLADRITTVESADEFYSIMGVLTREMLEFGLMDANDLVTTICTMAPFPFPQLGDLRDKYTYNIRPFTSSLSTRRTFKLFYSDDEDDDDEHIVMATWCVSNSLPVSRNKADANSRGPSPSSSSAAIFSAISPGAVSSNVGNTLPSPSCSNVNAERMTLDLSALKKQYAKLRERQKQAHVILTGGFQHHMSSRNHPPVAVNHLLIGKKPLVRKNKHPPATIFAMRPMIAKQNSPSITRQPAKHLMHQAILPKESGETLSWEQVKKQKKKSDSKKKTKTSSLDSKRNEEDKASDNDLEVNFISSDNSKKSSNSSSSSSSTSTELCDDDMQELSDYTSSPELHRKSSAQSNKLCNNDTEITSSSENEPVSKLHSAEVQLPMPESSSNPTAKADLQEDSEGRTKITEQTSLEHKISLPEIVTQSFDSATSLKVSPDKSDAISSEISPDSTEISPDSSSAESLSDVSENKSSESTDDTSDEGKELTPENGSTPEKEPELKTTEISFRSSLYSEVQKYSDKSSTTALCKDADTSNLFQQRSEESKEDSSKFVKTHIASSFREKEQISTQPYSPFPTVRRSSISSSVREAGIRLGIYVADEKQKTVTRDENQKFDAQGLPR